MILVGQYDSPFVRWVAVTLNFYRLPFERQALSVFVTAPIALTYMKEKQPNLLARRRRAALEVHRRRCEDLVEFRDAAYSAVEAERSGWHLEAS